MTTPAKRNAKDIPVHKVMVWYHLPFSITSSSGLGMWKRVEVNANEDQRHYFHSYITEALFSRSENEPPRIEHFVRPDLVPNQNGGQRPKPLTLDVQADRGVGDTLVTYSYSGEIADVSLRLFRPQDDAGLDELNPGMGILVVGVCFSKASDRAGPASENDELRGSRPLTLADTQNLLDWTRRVFPRWQNKTGAGQPYWGDMIARLRVNGLAGNGHWQDVTDIGQIAPWVKCLLSPWQNKKDAELFGDDRSFVTSAILLEEQIDTYAAQDALLAVSDADLFRLAEVDGAGTGFPYQQSFVSDALKGYRYNRHAPEPDGKSGNSTTVLIAPHHLCLIGSGKFAGDYLLNHTNAYYRHLQFLCVYEHYRLVQFSQRLTKLVKAHENGGVDFGSRLRGLRQEFLKFTHLHHFSNVSPQIQPREMFDKLYGCMELADRFREVEDELRVATEFQAAQQAKDAADRAENLNDLIAFSVPLTLITGLTGANLFIGANHPSYLGGEGAGTLFPGLWEQAGHAAWTVALVAFIWAIACIVISRRNGERETRSGQVFEKKYWKQARFWGMVFLCSTAAGLAKPALSWLELL